MKRTLKLIIGIVLLAILLLPAIAASQAEGGWYSKTYSSQCSGGTVEVWHPGGYAAPQQGSITVTGNWPEVGNDVRGASTVVSFVALSTGANCSRIKVDTYRVGHRGGRGSPPPPATPTPAPSTPALAVLPTPDWEFYDNTFISDATKKVSRSNGRVIIPGVPR